MNPPNIRFWLRRNPQPHSLRVRTEEDEVKPLKLSDDIRSRWKTAEEAIHAMHAVSVECIAADGSTLRAMRLKDEGDDEGGGDVEERAHKIVSQSNSQMAHVLDAQGRRISEAFDAGARAANMGQENLLDVVQLLTQQWSVTMQSLHNVSMNLANVLIKMGGGEPAEAGDPNGAMVQQLVGAAVARMMGGGTAPASAPDKKNGKG